MTSLLPGTLVTSATFSADARFSSANNAPPDQAILSADNVLFFVHTAVIRRTSANSFAGLLAQASPSPILVPENSQTLTIILCKAYSLPHPEVYDWPTLARAAGAVAHYGLSPPAASDALHAALLAHVGRPGGARDVYGLAAHLRLEPLAVAASAHLLSLDLSTIDDAWAIHIGPVYLRRLFFLHLGRFEALKRILGAAPPPVHAPTVACGRAERQRDVVVPWALTTARLVASARPDMSNSHIEAALNPIAFRCPCVECGHAIAERIQTVLREWSAIKVSAHFRFAFIHRGADRERFEGGTPS